MCEKHISKHIFRHDLYLADTAETIKQDQKAEYLAGEYEAGGTIGKRTI